MVLLFRLATRCSSVRASTSACLKWPLETGTSFSASLSEIEQHWRDKLNRIPEPKPDREKKFILAMFPYPSGNLHMGHMRVYTISDVLARYYRLNGFNVLHPIGWDAFGLPAENAAIERGVDPKEWTYSNIETMRRQLLSTGIHFDWDREILTCDPSFYRWTQWIFLRLFERGLLSRALTEVNYDPIDQTVLAAEQIDGEGRSWRSGALAEKRKLKQWVVDTPRYAKRLMDGLQKLRDLKDWGEVANIQANWIGQCDVYRFNLPLKDESGQMVEEKLDLRIKSPHQLASTEFILVRRQHSMLPDNLKESPSDLPVLTSFTALNFVTGRQMPIIIVPRTYSSEQAEFYLNAKLGNSSEEIDAKLAKLCGIKLDTKASKMSDTEVLKMAETAGYGGYQTSRTLQGWVVSRQRRWGTPIPMLLLEQDGSPIAIADDQLPVHSANYQPDGLGERIVVGENKMARRDTDTLDKHKMARRDPDTLDTFFDSSWYYLRFLDPKNETALVAKDVARQMMPVDVYVGGIEHADVHLFFARFISHFLYDIGAIDCEEPFDRLLPQGIVRGRTFLHPDTAKYVNVADVVEKKNGKFETKDGKEPLVSFEKMSKSKHNGIDPLDVLKKDGIDLGRLQLLEHAAPRSPINWGESDLKGLKRLLDRTAWIVNAYIEQRKTMGEQYAPVDQPVEEFYREIYNYFLRTISMLLEVLHLHNTAIARLHGFTNALRKCEDVSVFGRSKELERCIHCLIILMQVFAPASASEFWAALRSAPAIQGQLWSRDSDVSEQIWPMLDKDAVIDFAVIAQGVHVGRPTVDRRILEPMNAEQLLQMAVDEYHEPFFRYIKDKGHRILQFEKKMRPGLHVTLEMQLNVEADDVRKILEALKKEGLKGKTVRKKEKKKSMDLHA